MVGDAVRARRLLVGDARRRSARHGDAERRAGDRVRELRDGKCEIEREHDEHDADQHRGRDVDQTLDVPAHVELADEPVQEPRQHADLEDERQPGGPEQMRLACRIADDGRRAGEGEPLRGEEVDQREHAPLRDLLHRTLGGRVDVQEILELPVAPLALGLVLGDHMERALRQSLMMSQGSLSILAARPISATILLLAAGCGGSGATPR